jgi:hypothetical protein
MTGDLSILAGWRLLATTDGRLTGTLTQIWRVAGVSGDMTLESDLTTVIRVSQASARPTASGIVPRSLSDAMRALGGR